MKMKITTSAAVKMKSGSWLFCWFEINQWSDEWTNVIVTESMSCALIADLLPIRVVQWEVLEYLISVESDP